MPTIVEQYTAAFPKSQARHAVAKTLLPNGVTHDLRLSEQCDRIVHLADGRIASDRHRP